METIVEKTKKKLWQFGYSVKDVSDLGMGFDLLVDRKHKVRVLRPEDDIESIPKGIIVAVAGDEAITYHMCKGGKCWTETSPLKAFPKN